MVQNYFILIKNDEKTLDIAKKSLMLARDNYNNAVLMADLGMISKVDLEKI